MGIKSACLKDNFVVEFCSPPNYLKVGKGHKVPYAAQNDSGDESIERLVWMCPCHFFLHCEGVMAVLVFEGSSPRPPQHLGS